jgi:hypothetical protein
VRAWVEELSKSENNSVLFHKYQGGSSPEGYCDLTEDDFMIIIHSPFQKDMAQNSKNFPLTSVVVVDEYGEGFQ